MKYIKHIFATIGLILVGTYNAHACPKLTDDQKVLSMYNAIGLNDPGMIKTLKDKYCISPVVQVEGYVTPIFLSKNLQQLDGFFKAGVNWNAFNLQEGFPYMIPHQLMAKPYDEYKSSEEDKELLPSLVALGFSPNVFEQIAETKTRINHQEVINYTIDSVPEGILAAKDKNGLSVAGYLAFHRNDVGFAKLLQRNPGAVLDTQLNYFPLPFVLFLDNCHLDRLSEENKKKDVKILKSMLDIGLNLREISVNYYSISLSFFDAVWVFSSKNQEMIDLLKKNGYEKELSQAKVNADYIYQVLPNYVSKVPNLNSFHPSLIGLEQVTIQYCPNNLPSFNFNYEPTTAPRELEPVQQAIPGQETSTVQSAPIN